MRPPPHDGPACRIMSWNLAGMRAVLRKDPEALKKLAASEHLDVICLQETKIQNIHIEQMAVGSQLEGWTASWNCSTKILGYSGTAILSKQPPISSTLGLGIPEHDEEGRVVTVEFPDFHLVNTYVPNSGDGLRRIEYRTTSWDAALAAHIRKLELTKPVVLTGDLNCAHREIDIHSPSTNLMSAGFTVQERSSFSSLLVCEGFLVDTFRAQHPTAVGYTYYSNRFGMRAKGKGWRIDYFLVSASLAHRAHDSYIMTEVFGSDHLPIVLVLKN
ncbi:MAG: hypothetical protein WDW36_006131 [Sanguina aurantia]